MKNSVYWEKISQAMEYLNDEGIDLWLILSTEGSDPCLPLITGEHVSGSSAFIISSEGENVAVCSSIDGAGIEADGAFDQVIKYDLQIDDILKETLIKQNPGKIAINFSKNDGLCDGLTLGKYFWLTDLMGKDFMDRCISSENVLKRLRSIKTQEEVRRVGEAVRLTTEIYESIFPKLKPGLSEKEVSNLFIDEMIKRRVVGGNDKALSGPMVLKERMTHRLPSDVPIEPGDFLVMDYSVDYKGYASDIARTAYFLKPGETSAPKEMQKPFDTAVGAIDEVLNFIKPGVKGYEVDAVARKFITDRGFPEIRHATGHQIGRQCHDGGTSLAPRWERYKDAPYGTLEPGMIFAVEPTILQDDGPCVIVEENVLITNEGVEVLSKRQKELILIPASSK